VVTDRELSICVELEAEILWEMLALSLAVVDCKVEWDVEVKEVMVVELEIATVVGVDVDVEQGLPMMRPISCVDLPM
jgi:hypothetical protein